MFAKKRSLRRLIKDRRGGVIGFERLNYRTAKQQRRYADSRRSANGLSRREYSMPQNRPTFTDALARGVLVFDGAMGTGHLPAPCFHEPLVRRTVSLGPETDRDHPSRLLRGRGRRADHQHLRHGAVGPGEIRPGRQGPQHQPRRTERRSPGGSGRRGRSAGARSRIDRQPWPPNGRRKKPVEEMIAEQVAALWEGGADFIIFETQPSRAALQQCARPCTASPTCRSSSPAWWPARANRSPASRSNTSWPRCPATGRSPSPGE